MNNPLVQRAQYYLNESNRLTEELGTQIEYSRLLEAVLEEILTEEQILQLREKILGNLVKAAGRGLAGLALTTACTLGSGCGSKPVEQQRTSQGAGAEGQADLIGAKEPAKAKVVQKAKAKDTRTDKQKYPTAGPEGEI